MATRPCDEVTSLRGLGKPTCPCLASLESFGVNVAGAAVSVEVEDAIYTYEASYGQGGCAAHDALREPQCRKSSRVMLA